MKAYAMVWKEWQVLDEMFVKMFGAARPHDFAAFDAWLFGKRNVGHPAQSGLVEQQRLFMKALQR